MRPDAMPTGNFSQGFHRAPTGNSESPWLTGWESVFPDLRREKLCAVPNMHGEPLGLTSLGACRRQRYHRNMAALSTDDRSPGRGAVEEDDEVTAEYLWGSAIAEWDV